MVKALLKIKPVAVTFEVESEEYDLEMSDLENEEFENDNLSLENTNFLIADVYNYIFGNLSNVETDFERTFPNPIVNEDKGELYLNENLKLIVTTCK